MPRFMIKRVVKYIRSSCFLLFYNISCSQPTSFYSYKRQVEPKFLVRWPVVFQNMSSWIYCRNECMKVLSWKVSIYNFHRFGHFFAIFCELDFMKIQIKDVPLSFIVWQMAYPIVSWNFRGPTWSTIRLEPLLISKSNNLLLNHFEIFFNFLDPWEFFSVPPRLGSQTANIYLDSAYPGIISGHPCCNTGPSKYFYLFSFKKIHFLSLSTSVFSLLAMFDWMNFIAAALWRLFRKYSSKNSSSLSK
jgi:hypothetical protein